MTDQDNVNEPYRMVRDRYHVFATEQEALAAGYREAEYGHFQPAPDKDPIAGWIGLVEDQQA